MGKLEAKADLITGGGTGIGRAIALRFAREGARVGICGRRRGPLQAVAAEIEALGRQAVALAGDIASEADVQRIVRQTVQCPGGLDVLVNNASIVGQVAPVAELDLALWNEALAVNLTGAMLCSREALRHMQAKGMRPGRPVPGLRRFLGHDGPGPERHGRSDHDLTNRPGVSDPSPAPEPPRTRPTPWAGGGRAAVWGMEPVAESP